MTREEAIKVREMAISALEQEPILDKIRAEIEENYGHCDICEYFEDYDYEENDISEYRYVANVKDILQIIDKYRGEQMAREVTNRSKGYWIHSTKKGVLPDVYTCSVCGWEIDTCRGLMQDSGHRLYCEHCGADMRESTLFTKTTGHWIEHYNPEAEICMQHMSECSVCGKMICGRYNIYKNFCPNCGKRMEEQKTT
jgi:predicted RNA-binding Zn-ribbon protein involved in translation (DUF1610 family)